MVTSLQDCFNRSLRFFFSDCPIVGSQIEGASAAYRLHYPQDEEPNNKTTCVKIPISYLATIFLGVYN